MIKKEVLCMFLMFIFYINIPAQTEFSFRIIDFDNNTAISNALIIDLKTKDSTRTDLNGRFSMVTEGQVLIKATNYNELRIDLTSVKKDTIELIQSNQQLDAVIVNSNTIASQLIKTTNSISLINEEQLIQQRDINLASLLNTVPGVFMQSGTLNTNRVTIRGIGARNLFGTANIRAYYGDIPLTDGNGESSIEDLELNSISSIQILKGPSASSYGVGLGGAILFNPKRSGYSEKDIGVEYQFGSYGYNKLQAYSGIGFNNASLNINLSQIDYDGYRQNNNYSRKTFTIGSELGLGLKDRLRILGSYISLKGGIPSSLAFDDFQNSPREAAFTWGRSKAFEDLNYGLLGISWDHDINTGLSLITTVAGSFKDNYEPRPFNILSEDSNTLSLRSRFVGDIKINKFSGQFSAGGELFVDDYNNMTFENLYNDFDDGRGSVEGDQISGFKEKRKYVNLFAESNLNITENLIVNLGLHLNKTNFKLDDEFENSTLNNNGEFEFKSILSPKIGFNYKLNENYTWYGTIAHGFSTPTTAETLLPDGMFNPNLSPEIGWNFESGLRYKLLNRKLYGSVSLYYMSISDLLTTRRTQEGDFFAINAGKASYKGIEIELNYSIYKTDLLNIYSKISSSISDYRYKRFVDLDSDFSNSLIPGVPLYTHNLNMGLNTESGLNARISYQLVGKMAVNDGNTAFNDDYQLLNADLSYKNFIGTNISYRLYVSANNITDEKYASQIQVNAIGFGQNAPRFYYPGLPINIYSGIALSYRF